MLTLTVTACGGLPLAEPLSTSFDPHGGTIGRAETSQLVLADPERRVSRLQARVECLEGRWRLTQHGANPVLVNGHPVETGEAIGLADGDRLSIGAYDMRARIDDSAPRADFGDSGNHPLSLHRPPEAPMQPPLDVPALPCADPLSIFLDMRRAHHASAHAAATLSEPVSAPNTYHGNNALDSLSAAPQVPPHSLPGWGAGIDGAFPAAADPPMPVHAGRDESAGHIDSIEQAAHPPPDASLRAAFARGAGMNEADVPEFTPEFAARVGGLLRESLQGTVDLLVARQMIKQMVHARMTLIEAHDNNPLKHAANADAALKSVLGPPIRGYLNGDDALRDACNDLRAHQFGFLAGLRGSIGGLFARFSPQQIGASAPPASAWQARSRLLRDAQRWRHYERLYARLVVDSEEDFFTLFGKTFLSAYEEAVAQHKR
ncbi:type VI secretion system-associated FHA domain protein TagH [Caballeronia sp. BR00000012568055]|uniref:type VI secretion system-associated FHA domain protein TagH n=1 Tax=Caballeronia sp. BR00000012568055 TaxID=2918761 RepID=UPI0023F98488|nr:type VI secretion system-associated FHA domain protein TagH [Caballeronia sp. BR00000012568055]